MNVHGSTSLMGHRSALARMLFFVEFRSRNQCSRAALRVCIPYSPSRLRHTAGQGFHLHSSKLPRNPSFVLLRTLAPRCTSDAPRTADTALLRRVRVRWGKERSPLWRRAKHRACSLDPRQRASLRFVKSFSVGSPLVYSQRSDNVVLSSVPEFSTYRTPFLVSRFVVRGRQ